MTSDAADWLGEMRMQSSPGSSCTSWERVGFPRPSEEEVSLSEFLAEGGEGRPLPGGGVGVGEAGPKRTRV